MPHDSKGRLIEIGDWVKAPPYNYGEKREGSAQGSNFGKFRPVVGRVVAMREGQTCSGDFTFLTQFKGNQTDAFGADEAELVLKADGSEPASVSETSTEAPKTEEPPSQPG